MTTPVEKIKDPALAHPAYGCNRHEAMLALEGIRVSSITIQKILHEHGLGTKIDRWLALEARNGLRFGTDWLNDLSWDTRLIDPFHRAFLDAIQHLCYGVGSNMKENS